MRLSPAWTSAHCVRRSNSAKAPRHRATLERFLAEAEKRALRNQKKTERARVPTTDAEAAVMMLQDGGFRPASDTQLAAETGYELIVGLDVTAPGADYLSLAPILEQVPLARLAAGAGPRSGESHNMRSAAGHDAQQDAHPTHAGMDRGVPAWAAPHIMPADGGVSATRLGKSYPSPVNNALASSAHLPGSQLEQNLAREKVHNLRAPWSSFHSLDRHPNAFAEAARGFQRVAVFAMARRVLGARDQQAVTVRAAAL